MKFEGISIVSNGGLCCQVGLNLSESVHCIKGEYRPNSKLCEHSRWD